jgi:TolB protein
VERLTESEDYEIFPRFSPDGASIGFASGYVGGREADLHLMHADGSGERTLTSNPGREEDLAWSPRGDFIAFQAEYQGNFEIYIMSATGGPHRRLTNHPAGDFWPAWSGLESEGR